VKKQAIRLMVMGGVDVILAVLFGIYGTTWLHYDAVLAIFLVWIAYNLAELILPVSSS
jgi:hypothetical protein